MATHERTSARAPVLTVLGFKGGVGKTTIAFHLAAALGRISKEEVILVDGDPNRTATRWYRRAEQAEKESEGRQSVVTFRLMSERELMMRGGPGKAWLVIDTPGRPDSEDVIELARGSDLLILPATPDQAALEQMVEMKRTLDEVEGAAGYRVVINQHVRSAPESEDAKRALADLGIGCFGMMIRQAKAFKHALHQGVLVHQVGDTRGKAAWLEIVNLTGEILDDTEIRRLRGVA